jgi:hypothetical protein
MKIYNELDVKRAARSVDWHITWHITNPSERFPLTKGSLVFVHASPEDSQIVQEVVETTMDGIMEMVTVVPVCDSDYYTLQSEDERKGSHRYNRDWLELLSEESIKRVEELLTEEYLFKKKNLSALLTTIQGRVNNE